MDLAFRLYQHLRESGTIALSNYFVWIRKLRLQGFMLVELVIVLAILGTLAAIAIPNYIKYREKARIALAITEIHMLEAEIDRYATEHGDYPSSLDDIGMGLIEDPWGNPYQYLKIAGEDLKGDGKDLKMRKDHFMVPVNSDYDLYSVGPDGKSQSPFTAKASRDDIVRANDGGYVGLAANY